MISIEERVFHSVVNKERHLPKNVERWFAFNRKSGRVYLIPVEEFCDNEDGVGAAITTIEGCSAVIKGHYPVYSYGEGDKKDFCGCACDPMRIKVAIDEHNIDSVPSSWKEVLIVKGERTRRRKK
jgi:hypothetical protein